MKKTEISQGTANKKKAPTKLKSSVNQTETVVTPSTVSPVPYIGLALLILAAIILGAAAFVRHYSHVAPLANSTRQAHSSSLSVKLPFLASLPNSNANLSNPSTYGQSSLDSGSLSSSNINLQNNSPMGQGNTSSPLQSTGQAQSTGQVVNPSLPY